LDFFPIGQLMVNLVPVPSAASRAGNSPPVPSPRCAPPTRKEHLCSFGPAKDQDAPSLNRCFPPLLDADAGCDSPKNPFFPPLSGPCRPLAKLVHENTFFFHHLLRSIYWSRGLRDFFFSFVPSFSLITKMRRLTVLLSFTALMFGTILTPSPLG